MPGNAIPRVVVEPVQACAACRAVTPAGGVGFGQAQPKAFAFEGPGGTRAQRDAFVDVRREEVREPRRESVAAEKSADTVKLGRRPRPDTKRRAGPPPDAGQQVERADLLRRRRDEIVAEQGMNVLDGDSLVDCAHYRAVGTLQAE